MRLLMVHMTFIDATYAVDGWYIMTLMDGSYGVFDGTDDVLYS